MINRQNTLIIGLLLILITLLVFWRVQYNDFINYDDNIYVTDNLNVRQGISLRSVTWAFTTGYANFWHPLTWLSHMLDCQLYGLNPAGHHITNLIIHISNTVLLFWTLSAFTNTLWRSAFTAALFAIHPLHVEPVVWVAQRKDLLSTFFWVLTMLLYFYYTKKPGRFRYIMSLSVFILGLSAKPMLITLPFALLLLDYWPLKRFNETKERADDFADYYPSLKNIFTDPVSFSLFKEKIPFFILAGLFAITAFIAQKGGGAVASFDSLPLTTRLLNAPVSYTGYIIKMFWPVNLGVLYPHPRLSLPWQSYAGSIVLFIVITGFILWKLREKPYLAVGWLWYAGTLVPVIGLIQISIHSMADHYTYIPLIGLFIIISWGAYDLLSRNRFGAIISIVLAGLILSLSAILSWNQTGKWKDTITIFEHTGKVTRNNFIALNNVGSGLMAQDKITESIVYFQRALEFNPQNPDTLNNLGLAYSKLEKFDKAVGFFLKALHFNPHFRESRLNMGITLFKTGKIDEAIEYFEHARKEAPDDPEVYFYLGAAMGAKQHYKGAAIFYTRALELNPEHLESCINLGIVLEMLGKPDEAVLRYKEALTIDPGSEAAHINLGALMEKQGNFDDAVNHYGKALDINPKNAEAHNNSGALYSKLGMHKKALMHFSRAVNIRPDYTGALNNLGITLAGMNRNEEAVFYFSRVIDINPGDFGARRNKGLALELKGDYDAAIKEYRAALKLEPDLPEILDNLAWILATSKNNQIKYIEEAVLFAERACKLTDFKQPAMLDTLAVAYEAAGLFEKAAKTAERAALLMKESGR